MFVALTVRRLKPGTYDSWRAAWQPPEPPPSPVRATILRKVGDPDEVIAFGVFDGDLETMRADDEFQALQQRRAEAMAQFVESTGADGVYEIVEEVTLGGE